MQGAESLLIALPYLGNWKLCGCGAEVILQVEADSETLTRAWVSPSLQVFSKRHRALAGATLGNQYTLAGVNRAWHGIRPEQGRGCSTIIAARGLADPFSLVWKKNWNSPLHVSGIKKGSKTDETDNSTLILTTLLLTSPIV